MSRKSIVAEESSGALPAGERLTLNDDSAQSGNNPGAGSGCCK